MKLGEALTKEGLVTEEQLRRALERQVICGGRIGTNIVELGILTEEEFTKFLGRFTKARVVSSNLMNTIDPETIACISKEMAEKYKIIPFKKEKNRLHLAMLEPKIKTVDELRFITGFDIMPYVIPEIRYIYALEKYYDIKRDLRYVSIVDRFFDDDEPLPSAPPAPQFHQEAPEPEETYTSRENPFMPTSQEVAQPKAEEPSQKIQSFEPEKTAPQAPPEHRTLPTPLPTPRLQAEPAPLNDLNAVKEAFASSKERDQVAELFISESKKAAKRSAIFLFKNDTLTVWKSNNINTEGRSIKIDMSSPTFLADVVTKRIFYRGPVLAVKGNEELVAILGGTPQDSLSIPISIRDRVIALFYADNGNDSVLGADVNYLNTLAAMTSIAFEIIILRKKIIGL